jgi:hypothetical protein
LKTTIAQLALALPGWSDAVAQADLVSDPTSPGRKVASRGTFRVYDGSARPGEVLWWDLTPDTPPATVPDYRATRGVTFLARRLALHFVTGQAVQADLAALAPRIVELGFDVRKVMKLIRTSAWFHAPENRFALVEGPVSWMARTARALGYGLVAADSVTAAANRFPAWAEVCQPWGNNAFDLTGMRLLDPAGPNGWKEDLLWLDSNTVRNRAKVAAP